MTDAVLSLSNSPPETSPPCTLGLHPFLVLLSPEENARMLMPFLELVSMHPISPKPWGKMRRLLKLHMEPADVCPLMHTSNRPESTQHLRRHSSPSAY